MKRFSRNISILLLALLLALSATACQSAATEAEIDNQTAEAVQPTEPAETAAEPVAVEESVPEEAPPAASEDAEVPVSVEYTYMGYSLTIDAYDGYAIISYPAEASRQDVEAFLAAEAAKHQITGVTYAFDSDGVLRLSYPEGVSAEDRAALADTLASDLIVYVTPAPVVVPETTITSVYSYAGYELTAAIGSGRTSIAYPEFISDDDVKGFFAFENAKNDFAGLGVVYSIDGPGSVTLTYPEAYSKETVKAELDKLVNDLIAYITAVPEAVPAVVSKDTALTETYEYAGYTLTAEFSEGQAVVKYPAGVSQSEVEAFLTAESSKLGFFRYGVLFEVTEPGTVVFSYPGAIAAEQAAGAFDLLVADLIAYITPAPQGAVVSMPEPEPLSRSYSYAGYTLTAEFTTGQAVVKYPAGISQSEVEAFLTAESSKLGFFRYGVLFEVTEPGTVVFSYPEAIEDEQAAAALDLLVADLIEYITTPAPAAAPAAAAPSEYPFGIEPVVKASGDDDGFQLYIGHTNDVHGRIMPEEDGSMGYAKLATLLKQARALTDDILLLDGGDTLHGTNLANMFEGQTVLEIMDMLGYDAMVPGNHDFNYGAERLEEAAAWAEDNASLRILNANITDASGALVFQPYQIYDYNGFKVCVIGLTTPDTKTKSHPKNTEGLDFLSDEVVASAQAAIDIANELADFVIVLGHIGVVPDGDSGLTSRIICQSIDGIDLFIDGHSHTVMDGGELVNGTLIVSTGQYLNNLGIVVVDVDADGSARIADAFLLPATEVLDPSTGSLLKSFGITEVPNDPAVDAYVAEKQAELDSMLGAVVADIPMDLNGERADVRTKKTNLSALVCEAMTAESGADFTIVNGGGIRASLSAGPVTLGDVNNVLPFTNIIVVCEISPADVYAALEHGYSLLPEQNGAFSQTDLKVVYSASSPAGERIKKVYIGDVLLDRNDTETTYKVATNDFMAAGGDGYTMFGRVLTEGSMLNEVFCDYLSGLYPAK